MVKDDEATDPSIPALPHTIDEGNVDDIFRPILYPLLPRPHGSHCNITPGSTLERSCFGSAAADVHAAREATTATVLVRLQRAPISPHLCSSRCGSFWKGITMLSQPRLQKAFAFRHKYGRVPDMCLHKTCQRSTGPLNSAPARQKATLLTLRTRVDACLPLPTGRSSGSSGSSNIRVAGTSATFFLPSCLYVSQDPPEQIDGDSCFNTSDRSLCIPY